MIDPPINQKEYKEERGGKSLDQLAHYETACMKVLMKMELNFFGFKGRLTYLENQNLNSLVISTLNPLTNSPFQSIFLAYISRRIFQHLIKFRFVVCILLRCVDACKT